MTSKVSLDVPIGNQIRIMRAKRRISQPELAKRTGLSQFIISFIETNKALPTDDQLARIREALAWTPELDELVERLAAVPDAQK